MSGYPLRKPSDASAFREDYIKLLSLQANNDDMNLQANKIYKETGQLPAVSQMKDTRTTSEILADTERLKVGLLEDLKPLGSPNFCMAVIQRLEKSNLNLDGSLFTYFVQSAPEFVKNLQKKYKYGIKGDLNDVEKMVEFIENAYNQSKSMNSTVKSNFDRPLSKGNNIFTSSKTQLDDFMKGLKEVLHSITLKTTDINKAIIMNIYDKVSLLSRFFTDRIFSNMKLYYLKEFRNIEMIDDRGRDMKLMADIYKELNEYVEELPTIDTLNSLVRQLEKSTQNRNAGLENQILLKIDELLSPVIEISVSFERMIELTNDYGDFYDADITQLNKPNEGIEDYSAEPISLEGEGITKKRRGRPKGSGIKPKTTYTQSVKTHSDLTKGIEESPRFIKFGRYLINTQKLNNNNILSLKRPSGGAIVEIPSTRVSQNLSNIIKKMIGGSIPTFNELASLSEPEKIYLHKVSTKANISDKFSIPAPSKDAREKDIHLFEVQKGEIMAGNDNKDLIKKFKLHLIKLSRNGLLPKKEVAEVMEELINMGH
jgi:hypothetical protein